MQIMKITLFFPNGNSFIPSLTFNIITYILFMLQHSPFFFLCLFLLAEIIIAVCMLNIINNFSLLINLRYSFRNYFSFRRTFVMLLCCLCCCLYEMGKTFNVSRLFFFSFWLVEILFTVVIAEGIFKLYRSHIRRDARMKL